MGKSSRSRRKSFDIGSSGSSSSSLSSSSDSESSETRRRRRKLKSSSGSKRKRHHSSSSKKSSRSSSRKREATRDNEKRRKRRKNGSSSASDDESDSEPQKKVREEPKTLVREILKKFPDIAGDLEQLLQTLDNGQGVDLRGLPDKSLVKHLKKLFISLKVKQHESGVFWMPPLGHRTLDAIGPILTSHLKSREKPLGSQAKPPIREQPPECDPEGSEREVVTNAAEMTESLGNQNSPVPPRRKLIGPEMPSRELLDAAAELTEAETLLREADLEGDDGLLIGPPPPAMVAEAESANEAERFEEVARIASSEVDRPYDILGVNWKMSSDNIKKRYWKLSLMVHPDKCSHPQAHQAFVKLNQAFKDLQDPAKRNAIDDKIKLKEEQEKFKAELQALREAAQWRRLQGISIEGDEELLAITKEQEPQKRDEWMTTLPPERKAGVSMQSRSFSKTTKEGRGDTTVWTDSPLDKVQKAKQNYLEAYDRTKALADSEEMKKSTDADLVDKYNCSRRSKSLVDKHKEERTKQAKKKSKQPEKERQEWAGQHPWKPWDREKDLAAGRMQANLNSEGMAQNLTSRFSSGTVQRNFL